MYASSAMRNMDDDADNDADDDDDDDDDEDKPAVCSI